MPLVKPLIRGLLRRLDEEGLLRVASEPLSANEMRLLTLIAGAQPELPEREALRELIQRRYQTLDIGTLIDAFLGFPPEPQELRARKIGRVILSTTTDMPWSQYFFCCIVFGNRDFVSAHPIATKRYLRAVLKAADICAIEPARAAQRLVDAGFAARFDYALQTLNEIPYDRWREVDPEDALRFFALRIHEVGMIKSSPNALLAEGTDWRFLNETQARAEGVSQAGGRSG